MDWTTPVSLVVALAVAVTAIGALVRLVIGPLTGQFQLAAGAVVVLLVVALLAMVGLGARGEGDDWLTNGGYW
ncbi:hypothetical protein [Halorarius litoreus]|uniref:hypothetical protein n=1 Tax=Halorarius litoreus TaxID=2962676 RepID=UPI0020CCBA3A|nr:hypothetical protein [Halorarius litoreus]